MGVARRPAFVAVVVTGLLLAGCGSGGPHRSALKPCKLDVGGTLAAELPDGSLVVGAASHRGPKLVIRLRRVAQDCQVVRTFGTDGTATVSVASNDVGEIDALRATRDGRLVLAGGDGQAELVGRLREDGRLDHSFGDDGWARVKPRERPERGMPPPAPTATAIAFGRTGSIFLGGNDESAHCCVQDFVSELTAAGAPVRTFGDGGSIVLPPPAIGSYTTDVSVKGDGSVYVLTQYEQSGCGAPSIFRVLPNGSLDKRFDAATAQAVKRVQGRRLRFTPTLVPPAGAGGFVLVGGLDKTCVPPFPPEQGGSGGVAAELRRWGGLEHETRFRVPDYSFDTPAAIQLRSGRIVAAGLLYTGQGKLKRALVRSFAPDGSSRLSAVVRLSGLPRIDYVRLALVPSAAGGVWLVVGFPKEIELVPVGFGG